MRGRERTSVAPWKGYDTLETGHRGAHLRAHILPQLTTGKPPPRKKRRQAEVLRGWEKREKSVIHSRLVRRRRQRVVQSQRRWNTLCQTTELPVRSHKETSKPMSKTRGSISGLCPGQRSADIPPVLEPATDASSAVDATDPSFR